MFGIKTRIRQSRVVARSWHLSTLNRIGRAPIGGGDGPDVSLTSYGMRIDRCHITIESIARGTLRPRSITLWLDDAKRFGDLPTPVKRLVGRGLRVALCDKMGPHAKYYPYVEEHASFDRPLVTADDDLLYPKRWLQLLVEAAADEPLLVHAYRVREVVVNNGAIARYDDWPLSQGRTASPLNFATGVSGVIYPPHFLAELKARGRSFLDAAPRADDIWLHKVALDAGVRVRPVLSRSVLFPVVPGSQATALKLENVSAGGNDIQVTTTYSAHNLSALVAASEARVEA